MAPILESAKYTTGKGIGMLIKEQNLFPEIDIDHSSQTSDSMIVRIAELVRWDFKVERLNADGNLPRNQHDVLLLRGISNVFNAPSLLEGWRMKPALAEVRKQIMAFKSEN
jgi:hypothetical protein